MRRLERNAAFSDCTSSKDGAPGFAAPLGDADTVSVANAADPGDGDENESGDAGVDVLRWW